MPTIYHYQQPITVTQERYDVLITRRGYYAVATIPDPNEFKTPVLNPSYADVETLKTQMTTNTASITAINTQQNNERADRLTSGDESGPRLGRLLSNMSMTSGIGWFSFFTARRTQTVNSIRTVPGSASSGGTLARVALYTVDSNGAGTRQAISANIPTLWNAGNSPVVTALGGSVSITSGQRVCVGALFVGTTPPQLKGVTTQSGTELSQAPRLSGLLNALADLPASFVDADFVVNSNQFYCALVP